MSITRNSAQRSASLEESYQDIVAHDSEPGGGEAMLRLLRRINELFADTQLWGLTSHYRLVVQAVDDATADWLVTIAAGIDGTYYIQYLLPAGTQPWPNATVHGEAETLAGAERYLLIAMRESRGWVGNTELISLLERYGLTA